MARSELRLSSPSISAINSTGRDSKNDGLGPKVEKDVIRSDEKPRPDENKSIIVQIFRG